MIIDVFALACLTIMLQYSMRPSVRAIIIEKMTKYAESWSIKRAHLFVESTNTCLTRWFYLIIYGYAAFTLHLAYQVVVVYKKVSKHREQKEDEKAYKQSLEDLENNQNQIAQERQQQRGNIEQE